MIRNVVLIGFMGVGKSSSGRMIANQLGFKFIDMDKAIEKKWGMTIPQMFEQHGEAFFREKEKEMCREVAARKSVVISTGGGTVKDPENVKIFPYATEVYRNKITEYRELLQAIYNFDKVFES